jgi:hypothetical protein
MEAARNVELVLPETGVCSSDLDASDCCATEPTPVEPKELPVLVSVGASDPSASACCR